MLKDEIGDGGDDWTNGMNSDSDGCFFMTLPANKSGTLREKDLLLTMSNTVTSLWVQVTRP